MKRFPIRDQHYKDAIENDSLESACKEGRLYLADYTLLDEAESGSFPTSQKYIYAPLALFALRPIGDSSRSLVPVAIQCQQKCGEQNPIFTKKNGENWMTAKTIVQMADSNYHELISHLGQTHLFIEPFAIATYRQLSINHPVGLLLRQHFKGTFIINYAAHTFLVAPKGQVDELLAGTIAADRQLAVKGAQSYLLDFNDSIFPKTLKSRGVYEKGLLNYPYRDDALQIWDAIHTWVDNYLKNSYAGKDIQSDIEIQNWVSELLSVKGGRLKNFGEDGKIQSLQYLTDVISMIIFTASAQHAAVNFPQKDLMAYAPAFPLAAYSQAPTDIEKEKHFTELLPPLIQAKDQLDTLYLLGSVYHTRLGEYYGSHFTDKDKNPKVYEALQNFKNNLCEIEREINERNTYKFLLPSKIPQSINI